MVLACGGPRGQSFRNMLKNNKSIEEITCSYKVEHFSESWFQKVPEYKVLLANMVAFSSQAIRIVNLLMDGVKASQALKRLDLQDNVLSYIPISDYRLRISLREEEQLEGELELVGDTND